MADASNSLNAQRAAFWRVDLRTIQRWVARTPPLPVDDPAAMLAWVASQSSATQSKLSAAFRRRIDELRLEAARGSAAPVPAGSSTPPEQAAPLSQTDPDRAAFLAARATSPTSSGTGNTSTAAGTTFLRDLIQERDFAIFKLQRANSTNNLPVIKDTTEAITRLSGVIHDEELRAQKLGREIGDIIPRADYERQLRALAWWLVRCVDDTKAALAPRLAAASSTGPLYRQEVEAILEPVLLTTRVLEPLRRSVDLAPGTGAALPPWALAALRTSLAAALEDPTLDTVSTTAPQAS